MPVVQANGIDINYEVQGDGEPVVLIPYLAADQACYAFQTAEYVKHFTCFTVDLRGAGLSEQAGGHLYDRAARRRYRGVHAGGRHRPRSCLRAVPRRGDWHVAGCQVPGTGEVSSLHSAWPSTDPFLRVVVEQWRIMARALDSVTEMVIKGILPWCLTPELYAARPEYVDSLAEFVRGRPMPPVDAFLRQSGAVLTHDARPILESVQAPALLTFGRRDLVTSTRFAGPLSAAIRDSDLLVFEDCAHAPIYENVEEFNQQTLAFLHRHSG